MHQIKVSRFGNLALRLFSAILIITIIAAAMPGVAQASSKHQLSATLNSKTLVMTLSGSSIPSQYTYVVKVRVNKGKFQRIGTIRPMSDGKVSGTFDLPSSMSNAAEIRVCLKAEGKHLKVCTTVKME